jgi:high-affinity K+ transport system ATPase subunit B
LLLFERFLFMTVLLAVLTQVFLIVVATTPPLANYVNTPTTIAILISLLVALIPTTIGSLLSAVGIAGMDRVAQFNAIASWGGRWKPAAISIPWFWIKPARLRWAIA